MRHRCAVLRWSSSWPANRHHVPMDVRGIWLAVLSVALTGACAGPPPVGADPESQPLVAVSEPPDSMRSGWSLEEPASPGQKVLLVSVHDTCPGGPASLQAIEHEDRIELFSYLLEWERGEDGELVRGDPELAGCLAAIGHNWEVHLAEPVGDRKVIQGHADAMGTPAVVTYAD